MKTSLYGREYELSWLNNHLTRAPGSQYLPHLTIIYGPTGIGKTALLESFIQQTLTQQKNLTLIFNPPVIAGTSGVEFYAESLFRNIQICPETWTSTGQELGDQFSRGLATMRRKESPTAEAYSANGKPAALNTAEMAVVGDPLGHRLSDLCVEMLLSTLDQVSSKLNGGDNIATIFCFDQFADYSPSVKKWIGSTLMPALAQSNRLPAPRIILTAREPWDSGGQSDYWETPLGRMNEHELPPINRSNCIKWLVDQGVQPDAIDELMERTKGVPKQVVALLSDPDALKRLEEEIIKADVGASVSIRQLCWLHAAAILQYVNQESLSAVLGERNSSLALDWLKGPNSPDGIRYADTVNTAGIPDIFLHADLRSKIIAECSKRYPDRHQDFNNKNSLHTELLKKVPSSLHRDNLRRLVPIEPFDLQMIDKIYGSHE